MTIYFSVIACSIVVAIVSDQISNRSVSFLVRLVAIIPPAVVAGLRDLVIGTDIGNYGAFNFEAATRFSSLFDYLKYIKINNKVEVGYSLINYIVSRFTDSMGIFLFILNMLTLLFLVMALGQFKGSMASWFGLFVYYFTMWGTSLNVMRQSLAVTIVLWGMARYINNEKLIQFILIILLAMTIHQTAILGLFLVLIYKIFSQNFGIHHIVTLVLASGIILFFLNPHNGLIISIMRNIPVLGKYYTIFVQYGLKYITAGSGMSLKAISIQVLPTVLTLFLLISEKRVTTKSRIPLKTFFIMSLFLTIVFELVNINSGVLSRLGMYFSIIQVIAVPISLRNVLGVKKYIFAFLISMGLVVAFVITIRSGSGNLYPYTSQILEKIF